MDIVSEVCGWTFFLFLAVYTVIMIYSHWVYFYEVLKEPKRSKQLSGVELERQREQIKMAFPHYYQKVYGGEEE